MRHHSFVLVAAIASGLSLARPGSAEDRLIDIERSTVTVHVFKAGLFRALADDHIVQAPLAEGTFDAAVPHGSIVIDPRRMRVLDPGLSAKDREEVQARMLGPEVLDVQRFPRIHFHSVTIERHDGSAWLVRGELELRGRIRPFNVNVTPRNGHYIGTATVKQTDFGIVPISIAGGTVKVKDEIKVDFDIVVTEQVAGVDKSRGEDTKDADVNYLAVAARGSRARGDDSRRGR
jgi:hypothetical protein